MQNIKEDLSFQHISKISNNLMEEIEIIAQNEDKTTGLSTGIEALDKELCGINDKDLVVIGAYMFSYERPFILRLINCVAEKLKKENDESAANKNVLFFNLDSCLKDDIKMLIRINNGLTFYDLNNSVHSYSYKEFEKIMNCKRKTDDMPIYFNNGCFCLQNIQKQIQKFGYENTGLVVINSLQSLNDYQENKDMRPFFLELKNFAEHHSIPIVITCRLTDNGDSPALMDMPCVSASVYMDKIVFLKGKMTNDTEPVQEEFDTFEEYQKAFQTWKQKFNKNKCNIIIKKAYNWKHEELVFHFDSSLDSFEYVGKKEDCELNNDNDEIYKPVIMKIQRQIGCGVGF